MVKAQLYFYQMNQEGRGVGWEGCVGVGGTWRMRVTLSANENECVKKLSRLSFTLTDSLVSNSVEEITYLGQMIKTT